MTDNPGGPPAGMPSGGPVSDRMQALLSRAVEEQVSEQRAVSSVLGDLRTQVTALADGIRLAASDATVERLGGVVSTVVADVRTSTSLLGQRIEALSQRVDAVATESAAPTERAAVRLTALQADIATQADSVERMQSALDVLAGFPGALASLQSDVAGLHDRLQPLAEVRSSLGDLGARTAGSLDALRPHLAALSAKVDALGEGNAPERVRDAIVDALSGRLDRLEQAADRPVVGPEVLRSGLGDLRASLDGAMGNRLEQLGAALGAVENRLGQVGERLADVGDAAGGIPALATDLTRLAARVEELQGLHDKVRLVGQGVTALQDDSTGTTLSLGIAVLRDDLVALGERVAESAPPAAEDVAGLVSRAVADRLVETLAPRIADVVLTRVSAALVAQLGEALSPRVKADTEAVVRTVTADSERRVLAHVDEAVLALAEALLRRRRGGRTGGLALGRPAEEALLPGPPAPPAPGSEAGTGSVGDPASQDTSFEVAPVEGADVGNATPAPVPAPDLVAAEPRPAEPVSGEPVSGELVPGEPLPSGPVDAGSVDTDSEEWVRAPVGSPEKRPSVTTGLAPTFERATVPGPVTSAVSEASAVPASVPAMPVSPAASVSPSAPASAAAPVSAAAPASAAVSGSPSGPGASAATAAPSGLSAPEAPRGQAPDDVAAHPGELGARAEPGQYADPTTQAHDTDRVEQDDGPPQSDVPGRPAVKRELEPGLGSESASTVTSVTQSAAAVNPATLAEPGVVESSAPEPRPTDLADTGPDPLKPAMRSRPANRSEPLDADVFEATPASAPPPPSVERVSRPGTRATTRPATKPPAKPSAKPILEHTPEVGKDDLEPSRSAGGLRSETRPGRVSPPSPPSPPSSTRAGSAPHTPATPTRPPTAAQARSGAASVRSQASEVQAPELEAPESQAPGPQAAVPPSAEADRSQVRRPESARPTVRSSVTPKKGSATPQPPVWQHPQTAPNPPTSQAGSDQLPYAPPRPAKRKPWWRPGG